MYDLGRIVGVGVDNLKLKIHDGRLPHNPETPGKLLSDHAGHLIADLFGGSPELDNLVSQDKWVNMRDYRKLERLWYSALKAGKKIEVKIKISYDGISKRPNSFKIDYKIDGKEFFENISNISK